MAHNTAKNLFSRIKNMKTGKREHTEKTDIDLEEIVLYRVVRCHENLYGDCAQSLLVAIRDEQ